MRNKDAEEKASIENWVLMESGCRPLLQQHENVNGTSLRDLTEFPNFVEPNGNKGDSDNEGEDDGNALAAGSEKCARVAHDIRLMRRHKREAAQLENSIQKQITEIEPEHQEIGQMGKWRLRGGRGSDRENLALKARTTESSHHPLWIDLEG